jgi:hypothetical protein
MNRPLLPQALLSWMRRPWGRGLAPDAAPAELTLHCVGIDAEAQRLITEWMPVARRQLGLQLRLAPDHGDALLLDDAVLRSVAPWVLATLAEGRPRLVLRRTGLPTAAAERGVALDDLAAQLRRLREGDGLPGLPGRSGFAPSLPSEGPETQPTAADSGFDPDFDSRWPAEPEDTADAADAPATSPTAPETAFLQALLRLRTDPAAPPLQAVYAGGGLLIADGARAKAWFDAEAWMCLRLHEPLPHLQADAEPRGELAELELDLVLWMLGHAAGQRPLLEAPADWWHAPLTPVHLQGIGRYTLEPTHLAMARVLARGGVTPSVLRRECQVSERQLRGFLQACLFLCLVAWRPARLPAWAQDPAEPPAPPATDHAPITPGS